MATGPAQAAHTALFSPIDHAMRYRGPARVARLALVATHAPDVDTATGAALRAVSDVREREDLAAYRALFVTIGECLAGNAELDEAWLAETKAAHGRRAADLREQLQEAKASLSKDKTRVRPCCGCSRLLRSWCRCAQAVLQQAGDFFARVGDHTEALKQYLQAKNYASTPLHVAQSHLDIVRASMWIPNYGQVQTFALRGERAGQVSDGL